MARTPRKWQGARTPSGLKRVRQAERRRAILQPRRSAAKTLVAKAVTVATTQPEGADTAVALSEAISALDRAAKAGAIHPNAAARRKSRLVLKVNAAVGGAHVTGAGHVTKSTGKADVARLGITGFCWGGRIVLMYAAHNPQLKAAVAWYGPTARPYHPTDKTAIEVAGHVKAATLGLYGSADHGIPVDTVDKAFAAMRAGGNRNAEYHVYPDTPHAFFADYRPSYTKSAAEDGWRRATGWFKRYL